MEFVIDFERRPDVPLYRSLSNAIKTAISKGRLRPGEKIPSVRVLCELAAVSRNTAHQCYQTLISEGYIQAVQGKGVFVNQPLGDAPFPVAQDAEPIIEDEELCNPEELKRNTPMVETLYRLQDNVQTHQKTAQTLKHQMPSLEDLPLQALKKTLAKHSNFSNPSLLAYSGDPFGHPLLREAIANYVLRARAIKCTPEQVVVTARPSQQMLDLYCRLYLVENDWVAVEHPGYSQPRQIFELHNAHILPIPVDENGLLVEALAAVNQPVKMVYVTPSHQDPTGAILSLERRKQLITWAQQNDATIWEDDVENEYRYGSEPLPALYAMDTEGHVIYQSTFWRTLCPFVRLGFAILPNNKTKETIRLAKYLLDRDLPIVEQLALADLINEGHFERHVRQMRKKFTARRQTAVHGLKVKLAELVNISRNTSGLHLRAFFDPSIPRDVILLCGRESGLSITGTDAYYIGEPPANEFLIQFAHVDENQLKRQVDLFAAQLRACLSADP
jgi:GntR family transcriptional regulator / MocR family aminotransferase